MFTMVTQIDQDTATGFQEPAFSFSSFLHEGENNIEEIFEKIALLNEENLIKALETVVNLNFSIKWLIEEEEFPNSKIDFDRLILNLPVTSYIGLALANDSERLTLYHSACPECHKNFRNIHLYKEK